MGSTPILSGAKIFLKLTSAWQPISRYELSVEHSFLVGDKESDISAAKAAGIDKTALVRNSAINYKETNSAARWYVEDLIEFSSIIKKIHDY